MAAPATSLRYRTIVGIVAAISGVSGASAAHFARPTPPPSATPQQITQLQDQIRELKADVKADMRDLRADIKALARQRRR